MNPTELLSRLRATGSVASIADGRLRVSAPAGALTPEIKAELAAHKAELLALLAEDAASAAEERRAIQAADGIDPEDAQRGEA